jgi:hypothetical protein
MTLTTRCSITGKKKIKEQSPKSVSRPKAGIYGEGRRSGPQVIKKYTIRRTHGRYRKQMKHGYSQLLYDQRNKDETIFSVIKRLFEEHITSRVVRTQNRELCLGCIAYNMHRLTNLVIILVVLLNLSTIYQILNITV